MNPQDANGTLSTPALAQGTVPSGTLPLVAEHQATQQFPPPQYTYGPIPVGSQPPNDPIGLQHQQYYVSPLGQPLYMSTPATINPYARAAPPNPNQPIRMAPKSQNAPRQRTNQPKTAQHQNPNQPRRQTQPSQPKAPIAPRSMFDANGQMIISPIRSEYNPQQAVCMYIRPINGTYNKNNQSGKCKLAISTQGSYDKMSTTEVKLLGNQVYTSLRAAIGGRILFQRISSYPRYDARDIAFRKHFLCAVDPTTDNEHPFVKYMLDTKIVIHEQLTNPNDPSKSVNRYSIERGEIQGARRSLTCNLASIHMFEYYVTKLISKRGGEPFRVLGVKVFVENIPEFGDTMSQAANSIVNTAKLYADFVFEKLVKELLEIKFLETGPDMSREFAFLLPFAIMAKNEFFVLIGLLAHGPRSVSLPMHRVAKEFERYRERKAKNNEPVIKVVGAEGKIKTAFEENYDLTEIESVASSQTNAPNIMLNANGHILSGVHGYQQMVTRLDSQKELSLKAAGRAIEITPFACTTKYFIRIGRDTTYVSDDNESNIADTHYQLDLVDDDFEQVMPSIAEE